MQNPWEVDGNREPLLLSGFSGIETEFRPQKNRCHGLLDLHTVIYDTEASPVSGLSEMEAGIF